MRVLKLTPLLAFIAFFCLNSCSSEDLNENAIEIGNPPETKQIEIEILELINQHRISIGLNSLENNGTVKAVAFTHTDYMIEVDNISHDNFFLREKAIVENINAQRVSENVAYGYSSAASVVAAWINSPGHRGTIEGDFTNFDISAERNSSGKWYFTNIFIKR